MLFKSKNYPYGKYQILLLEGNIFNFKKSFGFWKHPRIPLGVYAKWTLRLGVIEIKQWLSESEILEKT
jgi:hypothetical protein